MSDFHVTGVDLCYDKNGEEHHTQKFELMRRSDRCLVVRRGQAFDLTVSLTGPFDQETHEFTFSFKDSDEHGENKCDTVEVPLSKEAEVSNTWTAVYKSQSESDVTVAVTAPADCAVGTWTMDIRASVNGVSSDYTHPQPIYILFNPWCEQDTVHMPDDAQRQEYVEHDDGTIYVDNLFPKAWTYAQFQRDVLDCALYVVKSIGKIDGAARGDPVVVVRALTNAANDSDLTDENGIMQYYPGVLRGNWSGKEDDYKDGTHPRDWISSLDIIQKFYETKEPVKYGQCWVFSGILTTICRALGIPCRPVTCYEAGHDANKSLTLDLFVDHDANVNAIDSRWNFHVWNEVWLDRPDLEAGYGGWQIIDATPQELSDNKPQCGPAPLKAVIDGQIEMKYDVPYVFAEVNADMVTWRIMKDGDKVPCKVNCKMIGQNITTKAVGRCWPEDLTDCYKSREGTKLERDVMDKVLTNCSSEIAKQYHDSIIFRENLSFDLKLPSKTMIGKDFEVGLIMTNGSSDTYHVTGNVKVVVAMRGGRQGATVLDLPIDAELNPGHPATESKVVTFDEYYKELINEPSFVVSYAIQVKDHGVPFVHYEKFALVCPCIDIGYDGSSLQLKLTNPLPIPLTNGKFSVHTAEMEKQIEISLDEDIPPAGTVTKSIEYEKKRAGVLVNASFGSKELHNVHGYTTIN